MMSKGALSTDVQKKDGIIDIHGVRTGIPITKRFVFSVVAAALSLLLISFLPLEQYGETTALALGFLVSMLILLVFCPINIAVSSIIIAVVGIFLGFWDWKGVGATFGSSAFLSILGMLIVAMGCEFTPFGKRLAYTVLNKFGNSYTGMILVMAIVSAILSSFVSTVAIIIMMSSIAAELLSAMHQTPGESKFGRALMLVVPMASIVGGIVLINGSPTGNYLAIQFLTNSTGGEYTVSYTQWAICGISCFLVTIIPICFVYIKNFKLNKSDIPSLPDNYYKILLDGLGPIGGSEIRWMIIVAAMIASMLLGMNTGTASLLFAIISMMPGIGTVPADQVFKKLPVHVMISSGLVPLLAKLFSETGLDTFMGSWISLLISNPGPLGLSIISAMTMGILVNVFVNANVAVSALVIGIFGPVCVNMGYNPVVVMMPSMFIASFFFIVGSHNIMLLNKGYGYWEMKDPILPGIIAVVFSAIAFPIVCYLVCPIFGISAYI